MVWCIAIGYIGPKTIPIMETEMAAAIKEGTSQTTNWKLLFTSDVLTSFEQIIRGEVGLHYRDEGINVDGVNGSKL